MENMSTLGADCFQNILITTFTLVVETVEATSENKTLCDLQKILWCN